MHRDYALEFSTENELLSKFDLGLQFFFQIWALVDNKTGYLTRSGLYKALALVAMAQQGKNPSDKLLENTESQGIIDL